MARLKTYPYPTQFWLDTAEQLKKEEAKNSLCLGLAYNFRSNPKDCIYQSAVFEGEELLGAMMVSRYQTNHNLIVTQVESESVAEQLFAELRRRGIAITGLIAEKRTAEIYQKLLAQAGVATKTNMTQGIYKCDKVKMPSMPGKVSVRWAEAKDIPIVARWIKDFHDEAVPHDPPVDGVELAKSKIEKGMIYVLEREGEPVSMAAWSRDIETSCSVNLVYTPKELRKNGYASFVTAALSLRLLTGEPGGASASDGASASGGGARKKEVNLYTDMTNPTSNKIYQDIGFTFVCDSVHLGIVIDRRR